MHKYTVIVQDYWRIRRVNVYHVETERPDRLSASCQARNLAAKKWGIHNSEQIHVVAVFPGHTVPLYVDPGDGE